MRPDISVLGRYTYLATELFWGTVAFVLLRRAGALRKAAVTILVLYPIAYVWDRYTLAVGVFDITLRTGIDVAGIPLEEHLFMAVVLQSSASTRRYSVMTPLTPRADRARTGSDLPEFQRLQRTRIILGTGGVPANDGPPTCERTGGDADDSSDRVILRAIVRLVLAVAVLSALVFGIVTFAPSTLETVNDVEFVDVRDLPNPSADPPPVDEHYPDVTDPDDPGASTYETDVEPISSADVERFVHAEVNDRRADHGLEPSSGTAP